MTNRNRQFHHGAHMLIGALRKTYGPNFAKGCADNERLSEVLAKDASLRRVIRDHQAGKFEQISRNAAPINGGHTHSWETIGNDSCEIPRGER